jgi:hypothetical protein
MALPELDRQLLIESLISKATKMKNVGGYKAISEIQSFLRTYIIEGNPNPASLKSPYIDTIKDPYIMTQIVNAGITEGDIRLVVDKREPNRKTIHDCMIHILETAEHTTSPTKKMITVADAKNMFLNALDPDSKDTSYLEYLSGDHLEQLRNARIIVADTDWVFHTLNLKGWEALLQNSNKHVSEMFTYFDTLTKDQKTNLLATLEHHKNTIMQHAFAEEILNPDDIIPLITAFAQIDEIQAPDLQEVASEGVENLFEESLRLISFDKLKHQIKERIIKDRYRSLSANYTTTLVAQDPFVMHNVTQDFAGWMNCTIDHSVIVSTICAPEDKGVFLKGITADSKLKEAVGIIDAQILNSLSVLNRTLPSATVEQGTHYLDSFKTFMTCYMFNEVTGACQSFWKTAESMIATAAEALTVNTATAANALLAATSNAAESVKTSLLLSPTATADAQQTPLASYTNGSGAGTIHDSSSMLSPYIVVPVVAISAAAAYGVFSFFSTRKRGYALVDNSSNRVEHASDESDSPKHRTIVVKTRRTAAENEGYHSDDSRTGLNPGRR